MSLRDKIGAVGVDAQEHFSILIYGDVGAGKTHFVGTAAEHPDTSPVLFLDVDGGTSTVRKFPKNLVERVSIARTDQLVQVLVDLENDGGETYKTVAIDSLSELQKLDIEYVMRYDTPQVGAGKQDEEVPSPREWGKTLVHMRKLVRRAKNLPCNVIFTCHARQFQDEKTNKVEVLPNLSRGAAMELPGFVDVCGYLSTEIVDNDLERRMIVAHLPKYPRCKDRLHISDDGILIRNPSVPLIWNRLKEQDTNG